MRCDLVPLHPSRIQGSSLFVRDVISWSKCGIEESHKDQKSKIEVAERHGELSFQDQSAEEVTLSLRYLRGCPPHNLALRSMDMKAFTIPRLPASSGDKVVSGPGAYRGHLPQCSTYFACKAKERPNGLHEARSLWYSHQARVRKSFIVPSTASEAPSYLKSGERPDCCY